MLHFVGRFWDSTCRSCVAEASSTRRRLRSPKPMVFRRVLIEFALGLLVAIVSSSLARRCEALSVMRELPRSCEMSQTPPWRPHAHGKSRASVSQGRGCRNDAVSTRREMARGSGAAILAGVTGAVATAVSSVGLAALAGKGVVAQKRAERRERILRSLDWTRYHLWVYFVDAVEPSYARARVGRFFFERVCASRDSSSLLYCAAGGIRPTLQEDADIMVAAAVPDLHASDLQNLMKPPYEFGSADVNMYDVIVASDESTLEAVADSLGSFPENLCSLDDFVDTYDEMLREEQSQGVVPEPAALHPGMLTPQSLERLEPGIPLRGIPDRCQVGPALGEDLPAAWQECLWSSEPTAVEEDAAVAGEVASSTSSGDDKLDSAREVAGKILRSTVGLERFLRASIPRDMRWWNDEE